MRFHSFLLSAMLCGALAAQVPQAFDFQAVARDASGNVLSAQPVSVRLTVHSGTAGGAIVYQETHAVSTNAFGLFSVAVGQGSTVQGVFADVSWGGASHFLQVELDASGGSNYLDMGTTQLLSVPYALHAGGVDCASVSLLGDTLKQANGCYVIIPGVSAANGGCLDVDNDGFYNNAGCPPLDCNDADALVNPGATELCGNGTDDDCDGTPDNNTDPLAFVLFYADTDGDGFGDAAISNSACAQPAGYVANDNDCDDTDPNIFPGQNCSATCSAAESAWVNANFVDYRDALMNAFSNCLFENDPALCIQNELEGAGFPLSAECNACGVTWATCVRANCLLACVQGQAACEACMNTAGCNAGLMLCFGLTDADADGWPAGSDCSDTNAAIHPQAPELCDGVDNDCDGQIDEGNVCCPDNDADGFTTCAGDCDDSDSQVSPDATEVCDGIDNNCDGQVDEGGVCVCAPAGTPCDDGNACTVNDTEDGACNCISGTNAPVGTVCDDGDPNTSNDVCNGTGICIGTPCTDNDADGFTTCQGDCNDNNLNINPARPELCNGVDDDCDGQVDEGCAPETCNGIDDDGDGLTDAADPGLVLVLCENQIGVCSGTQKTANLCVGGIWLTCAASDYAIGSPVYEVSEVTCDTQDNDCDGQVDEDNVCDPCSGPNVCNISGQCFTGGQANPAAYCQVCDPLQSTTSWSFRPFGTVCIQGTDCTFSSVCDGLGQCGPLLNRPAGTACDDGNPNTSNDVCNGTGICIGTPCTDNDADGFTTCQGDCNDNNLNINPGAVEVCDGVDNNCNGSVDDGATCPGGQSCIAGACQSPFTGEVEPNGTTALADANVVQIAGSELIGGAITPAADLDFFKVSNAAPDVWRFETFDNSGVDCAGGITTTLRFYNSSGVQLLSDATSGISSCSAISYTLPAGTGYIEVEETNNDGTVAAYRLQAAVISAVTTEVEPNDILAQATVLFGAERVAVGSHQVTTDADWYAITVPAGRSVRAELIEGNTAIETCESNGVDGQIALFTAVGVQLVADDDDGRGFCSLIDGTGSVPRDAAAHGLAAGTYYLRVQSSSTANTAANVFDYKLVVTIR